jgi:tetratricopeptide (TPR) repeat protein
LITSPQTGVVDRNVDPPTFEAALALKQKGNTLFIAKKYSAALMSYSRAREKLTSVGMLLSGDQRAAFVNILSNEAECYLRLKRYTEAQMSATEAITLDGKHVKSLLRRAKATFYGATSDGHGINPFAIAQAQQDLDKILRMDGDGVEEAAKLLEEMHVQARKDMSRIRGRGGLVDDY